MRLIGCLFLVMTVVCGRAEVAGSYNVLDYGAKGDGKTLDHVAINKAIEAATSNGGGQVIVPSGTYLCGSIHLKSNVDLHLKAGAKILASPAEMKAYDESEVFGAPEYQDGGHTYFHNSLIWAEGQQNISITGRGMIDGDGLTKHDTENAGNVQGGSIGTGDKAIALKLCRNVTIRDITIYRGGHFAIIATGCEIGTIDNVTIDTNRDGIDIDCCKYFTVSNSKVNTPNDDAIVLKSSYALKKPVICEHILITNCIVTGYKLGTFLDGTYVPEKVNWVCGRIKLGTESNGGYRNITISNCSCMWSSGLAFEVVDQGKMENIVVDNISMSHVHHYPIYITTGCRNRGPKERTEVSSARDIYINNVVADDCDSLAGIIVTGMEGTPIKNVSLSNIRIQYRGGGKKVTTPYREQGTNYPEPRWAGPTPAYGLFARHVDGLHLENVRFELMSPDERPEMVMEDVRNEWMERKKVSILGDSYSTFEDYITPSTNELWYYAKNVEQKSDVNDVKDTWWHQVISENGWQLCQNNSYSGATISYSGYDGNDYSARSFNTRMSDLGQPDIIFIFGATNDSWAGAPIGEYKYEGITHADLYHFRPALARMLKWMTNRYINTEIYFILNSELSEDINTSVKTICEHYRVPVIELKDIDKISGHPSIKGMRQIADQVNYFINTKTIN